MVFVVEIILVYGNTPGHVPLQDVELTYTSIVIQNTRDLP